MLIKEKQTGTRLNIAGLLLGIWMAVNAGFVFAANGLEVMDREREKEDDEACGEIFIRAI